MGSSTRGDGSTIVALPTRSPRRAPRCLADPCGVALGVFRAIGLNSAIRSTPYRYDRQPMPYQAPATARQHRSVEWTVAVSFVVSFMLLAPGCGGDDDHAPV